MTLRTPAATVIAAVTLLLGGCAAAPDAEVEAPVYTVVVTAENGDDLGTLSLRVECGDEADEHVLRGMFLYHNMTFWEAEDAFRAATSAEPACALGYWGAALSYVHPIWPDTVSDEDILVGRELLEQARNATIRSPRDDAYIEAVGGYYEDAENRSELERLQAFRAGWESVHTAAPTDIETEALYALALLGAATPDPAYTEQNKAGDLLTRILGAIPDHPGGLHYTIHAYDFPQLADRALDVANRYGKTIPGNSHALHMTSHIFTQVGMWPESIDYNRRAADIAARQPVDGRVSHQYLHALDYLAYAYLQQGQDDMALGVWEEMPALDESFDHAGTSYAIAAIPARYALERRSWEEAAVAGAVAATRVDPTRYPAFAAITTFAAGMGAARTGDAAAANTAMALLAQLRQTSTDAVGTYDWATQIEIQRLMLQSWIQLANGDEADALAAAATAADLDLANPKNPVTPGTVLPARESYADMLFELERYDEAHTQYALSLETSPNRYRSLLGAGDSARLAGHAETARGYYQRLLDTAAASTRDELGRVREFLAN